MARAVRKTVRDSPSRVKADQSNLPIGLGSRMLDEVVRFPAHSNTYTEGQKIGRYSRVCGEIIKWLTRCSTRLADDSKSTLPLNRFMRRFYPMRASDHFLRVLAWTTYAHG